MFSEDFISCMCVELFAFGFDSLELNFVSCFKHKKEFYRTYFVDFFFNFYYPYILSQIWIVDDDFFAWLLDSANCFCFWTELISLTLGKSGMNKLANRESKQSRAKWRYFKTKGFLCMRSGSISCWQSQFGSLGCQVEPFIHFHFHDRKERHPAQKRLLAFLMITPTPAQQVLESHAPLLLIFTKRGEGLQFLLRIVDGILLI